MKKKWCPIGLCFAACCCAIAGISIVCWPTEKSASEVHSRRAAAPSIKIGQLRKAAAAARQAGDTSKAEPGNADEKQAAAKAREKEFLGRWKTALIAKDARQLVALGQELRDAKSFPDYKKWVARCFREAAKLGDTEAMMLAGRCAETGFGMASDPKHAFDLYFQAGEAGVTDGYSAAARVLLAGKKEPADVETALVLIDKALAAGSTEAKFLKGSVLLGDGTDIQGALGYIMDAARADYPDAQLLLARLYKEGKYIPKDEKLALEWTKYAADTGLASASAEYANLILKGGAGSSAAASAAIESLVYAANQGDPKAAMRLANMYKSATSPTLDDVARARHYAEQAFAGGYYPAAFFMASSYAASDPSLAADWMEKGVKTRDWRSVYADRLTKNDGLPVAEAIQIAAKASREEAVNYAYTHLDYGSSDAVPPQVVSRPRPVMPASLSGLDLDATVKVQFVVNEHGTPVNVRVASSSGYEEVDRAAVEAVEKWRYKPSTKSGIAQPAKVTVPMTFHFSR